MFVEASTSGQTPGFSQTSLTESGAVDQSMTDMVTDMIVEWIMRDCGPIYIVIWSWAFIKVLKATLDAFRKPLISCKVLTKINQL